MGRVIPRSVMLRDFQGETVHIPRDWMPTAEAINALPAPLRCFIHDLLTECDPAGTIRENVLLRDENYALRLKLVELIGDSDAAAS
jgi:hypothetical protein